MPGLIVVVGATGRLGRLVVGRLLSAGQRVRVISRRPHEAIRLWGERVEVVVADLAAPQSLHAAFENADRLFLLSPIHHALHTCQIAAIDAARAAGLTRIVKISGSNWTIENRTRSVAGTAHAQVEAHLAASRIPHTVLRPNAWMQVVLGPMVSRIARGEDVPVRLDDAPVSFIAAEDIADVAVHALLADQAIAGPLVLTGARAFTSLEVAHVAATLLKRPLALSELPAGAMPPVADAFERRAVSEFLTLIGEGHAAGVTDTVRHILGHAPASVEQFLIRQLQAVPGHGTIPQGEKTWH